MKMCLEYADDVGSECLVADDDRRDDLELETSPWRVPDDDLDETSPCCWPVVDEDFEETSALLVPDEDLSEDLASDVWTEDLEDSDCLEADKDRAEDLAPVTDDDVDSDCLEEELGQKDDNDCKENNGYDL